MKKIIFFIATLSFMACSKTQVKPSKPLSPIYYYKITETDYDGYSSTSAILFVKTAISTTNDIQSVDQSKTVMDSPPQKCKADDDKNTKCKMMPVLFVNVGITYNDFISTLYWTSATEVNVKHYNILRSVDQNVWLSIATLQPLGQGTKYVYEDYLK